MVWIDTDDGLVVKKRTRTEGRGLLVPDDLDESERDAVADELRDRVREHRDRNCGEA